MNIPAELINERSFGVVPISIQNGVPHMYLIQHYSGAWLLPKGRPEPGETKRETASRELTEETGLRVVQWLRDEPFMERYQFFRGQKRVYKEACYFLALVSGTVSLQASEVKTGKWEEVQTASSHVSFSEMQRIVRQVSEWCETNLPSVNDDLGPK